MIDFQRALSELGRPDADVYGKVIIQLTDAEYASSQQRTMTAYFYAFTFQGGGIETTTDLS